jgi:hypothetical protein
MKMDTNNIMTLPLGLVGLANDADLAGEQGGFRGVRAHRLLSVMAALDVSRINCWTTKGYPRRAEVSRE